MKTSTRFIFLLPLLALLLSCKKTDISPEPSTGTSTAALLHQQACHQYFYYYNGQQQQLGQALTGELNIGFKKGTDLAKKLKVLEAYPQIGHIQHAEETAGGEVTVVALQPGVTCWVVDSLLQVLPQDNHIDFAGAYFQYPNFPGAKLGLTNSVIVTLAAGTTQKQFSDVLAQTRTVVAIDFGFGSYVLRLTRQAPMDCLQTANYLFETGLFEASEPDFMIVMPPL